MCFHRKGSTFVLVQWVKKCTIPFMDIGTTCKPMNLKSWLTIRTLHGSTTVCGVCLLASCVCSTMHKNQAICRTIPNPNDPSDSPHADAAMWQRLYDYISTIWKRPSFLWRAPAHQQRLDAWTSPLSVPALRTFAVRTFADNHSSANKVSPTPLCERYERMRCLIADVLIVILCA